MKRRNTLKRARDRYAYQLMRRFSMTPEDFVRMLLTQGKCCLICKRHMDDLQQDLVVDHCHDTSTPDHVIVRGLLCKACNQALGLFQDDPVRLQAAIDYLSRFPKFCALDLPSADVVK